MFNVPAIVLAALIGSSSAAQSVRPAPAFATKVSVDGQDVTVDIDPTYIVNVDTTHAHKFGHASFKPSHRRTSTTTSKPAAKPKDNGDSLWTHPIPRCNGNDPTFMPAVKGLDSWTITFENPRDCTIWHKSFGQNITWSEPGPKDPRSATLQLLNTDFPNTLPADVVTLATKVPTKWQTFEFNAALPKADGYSIRFVDDDDSSIIYAQTGKFAVGDWTQTPKDKHGKPIVLPLKDTYGPEDAGIFDYDVTHARSRSQAKHASKSHRHHKAHHSATKNSDLTSADTEAGAQAARERADELSKGVLDGARPQVPSPAVVIVPADHVHKKSSKSSSKATKSTKSPGSQTVRSTVTRTSFKVSSQVTNNVATVTSTTQAVQTLTLPASEQTVVVESTSVRGAAAARASVAQASSDSSASFASLASLAPIKVVSIASQAQPTLLYDIQTTVLTQTGAQAIESIIGAGRESQARPSLAMILITMATASLVIICR